MNVPLDLTRDRERRLLNQRAFPDHFVRCSCRSGCPVCAHTSFVSKAEARQIGHRDPPGPSREAPWPG
jgi:hypothetical protein